MLSTRHILFPKENHHADAVSKGIKLNINNFVGENSKNISVKCPYYQYLSVSHKSNNFDKKIYDGQELRKILYHKTKSIYPKNTYWNFDYKWMPK